MGESMETEVPKEKQTELETKATALVKQAKDFAITTATEYERAIKGIDKAKAFQAEVKAVWDPVCDAANKAHKVATAGRKDQMAPFLEAEGILKGLCNEYSIEQDRQRREAQKKIDDENRRKEAAALKKAEELEAEGKTEEAEAVVEEAVIEVAKPASLPPVTPKGIVFVDNWKAEIVSPKDVPREYCMPDEKLLNKLAKERKGEFTCPGVQFVNDHTIRR